MHRKENCSIPRLDLLDQSRYYIQHTKKLKKMKPAVDTSSIEPVNHFSVAHKEKEKEWEYADSISKMCYSQIQSSKNQRSPSKLSTSRRNASINSTNAYPKIGNKRISSKPQFNLRTNIFPSSPKGGIYNYSVSFDSSSLSASGMISPFLSPKTQIDEDGSVTSASTSVFLTQHQQKNYEKYQYTSLDRIQNDPFEISIKDGMKFVEFSRKSNDNAGQNENLALRLNSKFRRSFFIGPVDSNYTKPVFKNKIDKDTEPYLPECDLQFDFHSNQNPNSTKIKSNGKKRNKKSKKTQLIDSFEHSNHIEKVQNKKHKRSVKLKILPSFLHEFSAPKNSLSIKWADQKDLLGQDEIENNQKDNSEGIIGCYANPIDNTGMSSPNTTRTAVNFTFDSDDDESQIILEQSPLQFFESFELEISLQQHVLDISLNEENEVNDHKLNEEEDKISKETEKINIIDNEKDINDFQIENAKFSHDINDTNKLEILPNQLLNLINDPAKKDAKNGTTSNNDYSYYSSEDEK